jgi:hypothetical protein
LLSPFAPRRGITGPRIAPQRPCRRRRTL